MRILIPALLSFATVFSAHAEAEKDRYNLSDLYPTPAAWDADAVRLQAQFKEVQDCKGKLGTTAVRFGDCLALLTDASKRYGRLVVYASETRNQDTRDKAGLELAQRAQILGSKFGQTVSFVAPEVLAMGARKVDAFVAQNGKLAVYRHYLDNILRKAPHTLDAKSEDLVAQFSLSSDTAESTYTILSSSDMPWPKVTLSDGSTPTLDQSAYTRYRGVANRADRKLVMDAFFGQYKKFENTFGATLYGQMKVDSVNAKVHLYPDVISERVDDGPVPIAVYDTLIAQVNATLPTLHRYFRMRAMMLGVIDLHYYDIYPPLVSAERKYSLDEAKALTLAAVAPLGAEYVSAMSNGFDNRWMDAYPRPRKLPGAHMNPGAYDVHPYVLMNYNDDYESVSTLAHEWGHALHSVLAMKAQPYVSANYPIFIAEIASTFNEALLLDHVLKVAKSDDERLLVLGSALENLRGTYYRQAMFAEFERVVHAKVDNGEAVSGAALSTIYGEILRRYHGDAVTIDEVDTMEWANIPHFYGAFYVYQYATSIAASSLFADSVLKNEPGARDRYLGLLRAGGSDDPYDLVKKAGVDLASPAPYRSIAARMDRIMDEIEAIQKRKASGS